MTARTSLAGRRLLPRHGGDDVVVVTDEDAALSLLVHLGMDCGAGLGYGPVAAACRAVRAA
jgi:hypothetical protein